MTGPVYNYAISRAVDAFLAAIRDERLGAVLFDRLIEAAQLRGGVVNGQIRALVFRTVLDEVGERALANISLVLAEQKGPTIGAAADVELGRIVRKIREAMEATLPNCH